MKQKIIQLIKKHGWLMAIAIIVPGGELLLLGAYLFNKLKKSENSDKLVTESPLLSEKKRAA